MEIGIRVCVVVSLYVWLMDVMRLERWYWSLSVEKREEFYWLPKVGTA